MLVVTDTLSFGKRSAGTDVSIAGTWQCAPASTRALATAEPSAPVPPVMTMWLSRSVRMVLPRTMVDVSSIIEGSRRPVDKLVFGKSNWAMAREFRADLQGRIRGPMPIIGGWLSRAHNRAHEHLLSLSGTRRAARRSQPLDRPRPCTRAEALGLAAVFGDLRKNGENGENRRTALPDDKPGGLGNTRGP